MWKSGRFFAFGASRPSTGNSWRYSDDETISDFLRSVNSKTLGKPLLPNGSKLLAWRCDSVKQSWTSFKNFPNSASCWSKWWISRSMNSNFFFSWPIDSRISHSEPSMSTFNPIRESAGYSDRTSLNTFRVISTWWCLLRLDYSKSILTELLWILFE